VDTPLNSVVGFKRAGFLAVLASTKERSYLLETILDWMRQASKLTSTSAFMQIEEMQAIVFLLAAA